MIRGIGHVLFSTYAQTSNGHDPVPTSGEPLEQVITLGGPISVSIKMAMRHEPNMALRLLLKMSKNTCFSNKKCEVLFSETVFL